MSHPDQWFGDKTFSQHGEDLMFMNLIAMIGGIPKNRYAWLDLGAHHPLHISNTALLYNAGHRGVNIEANPHLIRDFQTMRPEDVNVCIGVAPEAGTKYFYVIDHCSGRNTFSQEEAERFVAEHKQFKIKEKVPLRVMMPGQILDEFCEGLWPTILSTDLEGLDHDVLESASKRFNPHNRPAIICFEQGIGSQRTRELLRSKNYFQYCRMGVNIIFVHEDYKDWIY